ncbi:MAG: nicotinate (nicotinamide) nucleotide adenylyltransferase [candidate division WOR-3 bacterium]|jgi:nicotinate-nucleotide adenylyltransferase
MAIAVLGGRFDPIHIGHLIIAEDLLDMLNVEKVIFLLSYNPPHKQVFCSFEHRFNMIKIAIRDFKKFEVWDIEKKLNLEKSFSYLVLKEILKFIKEPIYFVIGSDQFEVFKSWYEYEKILEIVNVVVVQRPNINYNYPQDLIPKVKILNNRIIEVSSSEIRKRIKEGKEYRFLVPNGVYEYIKENHLYY